MIGTADRGKPPEIVSTLSLCTFTHARGDEARLFAANRISFYRIPADLVFSANIDM